MSGLGKLKPNVLLMGYSNGWATATEMSNEEYVSVITSAFDNRLSVMILYAREGFDVSDALNFDQLVVNNSIARVNSGAWALKWLFYKNLPWNYRNLSVKNRKTL